MNFKAIELKSILELKEPRDVQLLNQHVRIPNGRCDFQFDSIWSTVCCDLNVAFLFIWIEYVDGNVE
jgi:hypothetical protein